MTEHASQPLPVAIAAIVSAKYALSDSAGCAPYAVQGVVPACVAAPGSLEELAAVMRVAAQQRAAVTPWGGGTQQTIGEPPSQIDLLLRTERLDRVLIHEPHDLTISVEAGLTIGVLNRYLAQHGQMLPLDPALPGHATIGGLLATAADGPRRLGYGTLRDLLIGITVVEASGRISHGGGMVVKNVSGFDMMKLYMGSYGTLAIIASANFKLLPVPRTAASLLCLFEQPSAAFASAEALQLTQLTPTAAEYVNRAAMQALGMDGACALVVRAEGLPEAVERHITDISVLAERHGAQAQRIEGDDEVALWAGIADLSQTATLAANEALFKLTTLPAETEHLVEQIEALAGRYGANASVNARALNGVVYARLQPVGAETLAELLAALPTTQWIATAIPGAPHWGPPPQGLDVMQRIKREFDPLNMLNPGRFLAGV